MSFLGDYMSSSVHIDDKGKDILILGEGSAQGLDDTTLTAEAIYPINFTQANKIFDNSMIIVVRAVFHENNKYYP